MLFILIFPIAMSMSWPLYFFKFSNLNIIYGVLFSTLSIALFRYRKRYSKNRLAFISVFNTLFSLALPIYSFYSSWSTPGGYTGDALGMAVMLVICAFSLPFGFMFSEFLAKKFIIN